jgi:hypothetical protein
MLKEIFFDNWKKIIFVYFIVLLETIFFSIQPTIIGNAIDDLINGSYLNIYIYSVFIVFLLAIGTARRFLDTRIYISIWKDSVLKSIEKMRSKNVSSEKIFSRYNLTNYYVDAFEVVIPHMIKDVVFSFMSIFMVFLISHQLSIILILMIAISVLNYIIIGRMNIKLTLTVQQAIEETQKAIENKTERIPINKRGSIFIKRSDLDAYGYGVNELCWIVGSVCCVIIVTNIGLPIGEIMATILYVDRIFIITEGLSGIISHWNGILATDMILNSGEEAENAKL